MIGREVSGQGEKCRDRERSVRICIKVSGWAERRQDREKSVMTGRKVS